MNREKQPVWITGVGLLSSHGEGPQAHVDALLAGKPANLDEESYAPYSVHRVAEPDWSGQISRRDMRQMEGWQRIGTYTAGLALDDAGVKGDEALCDKMDMIIAAGGGERDIEVDTAIMASAREANDIDTLMNERLLNDLRPTLFLAQLSNLLAGNISIVHKVTGSSRTFMGEEGAGISALHTAFGRISSGQSDLMLIGAGYNGEREDMLLLFDLGDFVSKGGWSPVWERAENAGFDLASVGAFLVLESKRHAEARGASPYAELDGVEVAHGRMDADALWTRLAGMAERMGDVDEVALVLSGATGCSDQTATEKDFLAATYGDAEIRGYGSVFGHGVEVQFLLGTALAALVVKNDLKIGPFSASENTGDKSGGDILVTTIGHHRAEGMARVKAAR